VLIKSPNKNVNTSDIIFATRELAKFKKHKLVAAAGYEGILLYVHLSEAYDEKDFKSAVKFFHMISKYCSLFTLYKSNWIEMYSNIMEELYNHPNDLVTFLNRKFIIEAKLLYNTDITKILAVGRVKHPCEKNTIQAQLLDSFESEIANVTHRDFVKALSKFASELHTNAFIKLSGDHSMPYQKSENYECRGFTGNVFLAPYGENCYEWKEDILEDKIKKDGEIEKLGSEYLIYKIVHLGMENKGVIVPNEYISEIAKKYYPNQLHPTSKEFNRSLAVTEKDNVHIKFHTEVFNYIFDVENDGKRFIEAMKFKSSQIESLSDSIE
tara:strand:- start:91 stop:1065 length:975 start_codon:yes stop_codon:yes gene_type:complete